MQPSRHQAREWATQFLFQLDFNPAEDMAQARMYFWEEKSASKKWMNFTNELVDGVMEHRDEVDVRLKSYSEHWDLHRINAVDRNVLRLALYEMFYRDDIPPVVSVNEAITLAKELSSEESGSFVNGILDRALKDVDRPLRTPSS